MHRLPSDYTFNSQSTSVASSPAPLQPPTDDAIEAVILLATSARHASETRPLRDTRTQLFVGNLPYRVRWQDLKDLFRKAGTVLRADVSLGPDNRSRGYGTVLLATAEDAGRAVDMFNGYSWQSRVLEVRLDRLLPEYESQSVATGSSPASAANAIYPLPSTSSHHPSPSSFTEEHEYISMYQSADPASCRNLFVGNLPFHCQWQDLKDLFRQAGTILRADVALGPDGRSRGFGTVVFATDYDAEKAVRMFNGYEYNNRILKVNYDKFSQANQPVSTSESPITVNPQGQPYANSMQIKLPPGFMLDYGSPSGPTSPYEMFSQLQQQHQLQQRQQQHRQQLHQPQAQHYLQQHSLRQQRMQPQQPSSHVYNAHPSALDIESLTNTLASSHLSKVSQTNQGATTSSHKPSPISTAASSSHTSSSSEHSISSTSASSVSQSPNPVQTRQQTQNQHQQPQHPHHPGPITLPPLRPPIFPLSPHTPQASLGISTSPLHHPSMGSPYQMYSSSVPSTHAAVYQQQYQQQRPQIVPLTPHGLPPITPSMPPFTFLQPSFNTGHHQPARAAAQNPHTHVSRSSKDSSASGSSAARSSASSSASSSSSSTSSSSLAARPTYHAASDITNPNHPQQQHSMQYPSYSATPSHFAIPLPSPGLYIVATAQQPQPPSPAAAAQLRLNLASLPGVFSPGVVMSPGTFYGRPGDVPNPNPFINAAVGAPVHVHSPGGALPPPAAGSPGRMMYGQGHPHVTHGAYFYAMSSPKQGPPSAMEPKGYFDPMYFPVGVGGIGGSGLANEVLRDQDGGRAGRGSEAATRAEEQENEFGSPPGEASVSASAGTRTGTGTATSAASSGSSLTSWDTGDVAPSAGDANADSADKPGQRAHEGEGRRAHSSDEGSGTAGSDETVDLRAPRDGTTISRTHSVGYKKKKEPAASLGLGGGVEGPGMMSRGNSDPLHGSAASSSEAAGAGAPANILPMTLRLPERVPWSRKHDAVVHTPTARTMSASAVDHAVVGVQPQGASEGGEGRLASSTSLPSFTSSGASTGATGAQ